MTKGKIVLLIVGILVLLPCLALTSILVKSNEDRGYPCKNAREIEETGETTIGSQKISGGKGMLLQLDCQALKAHNRRLLILFIIGSLAGAGLIALAIFTGRKKAMPMYPYAPPNAPPNPW